MNNNYHTQMDKPNNTSNEFINNNHLLHHQMQNFQGTPINKTQNNPQLNQMGMNQQQMNSPQWNNNSPQLKNVIKN